MNVRLQVSKDELAHAVAPVCVEAVAQVREAPLDSADAKRGRRVARVLAVLVDGVVEARVQGPGRCQADAVLEAAPEGAALARRKRAAHDSVAAPKDSALKEPSEGVVGAPRQSPRVAGLRVGGGVESPARLARCKRLEYNAKAVDGGEWLKRVDFAGRELLSRLYRPAWVGKHGLCVHPRKRIPRARQHNPKNV